MDDSHGSVENTLNKAMPWAGLYIVAASAICTLAMAADLFNGFRCKKLWFPCKYFSLNGTSLTLLAVALKLPMDLNTDMFESTTDMLAKYISSLFMSVALANFMSSLGSMKDKEILANVVALGILVTTTVADVLIQLFLMCQISGPLIFILGSPIVLMLLLLATLISLAVAVPTTKRSLESKYQEQHKLALREEDTLNRREAFTIRNQRGKMIKYLVMAETSSPQFVMARSVICSTSATICWLAAFILVAVCVLINGLSITRDRGASPYGDTTKWILYAQSTGVVVGTIAPTLRWFVAISFKCSATNLNSFRKTFKIEVHWIQNIVDWRDSFSVFPTWESKSRKYFHDAKWFILTFCIGVQIVIVLVSKLVAFLSALLMRPFYLCFTYIKKVLMQHLPKRVVSNNQKGHEAGDDTDLNLSRYTLLLEGEAELPRRFLKNICREADNLLQTGRKKPTLSLVDLLDNKFVNFRGVGQFDSTRIPSLLSQEPPNCWTLPVMTLTSIANALPNIEKHKCKKLLSSVSQGFSLSKLVEKTSDESGELANIRKAAYSCWVGVVLHTKWMDVDLKRTSLKFENSKEVLRQLSDKAERIVMKFEKEVQDPIMENPRNLPAKVVAANSMYRISRTILLSCEEENEQTNEGLLFERLSIMIADILAACLTNLPHVITTMCHRNSIEKRDKSVRKAFLLLGKTEKVIQLLQNQEWPSLEHDKAADIEEWRALLLQDKGDLAASASTSTSSDETAVACAQLSSERHLAITLDS